MLIHRTLLSIYKEELLPLLLVELQAAERLLQLLSPIAQTQIRLQRLEQ